MFKRSGFFITQEELEMLKNSEYPGVATRDLLFKYHFPAESGICKETGEVFFETIETKEVKP